MCHDERHLAARHHAHADLHGIAPIKAAEPRRQRTADDFAQKRDEHKADGEQHKLAGKRIQFRFKPDARKKYGAEQHVGADVHLFSDVFRITDAAQDHARNICARNVRDAEKAFGDIRHAKAQRKPQDRDAARVRPAFVRNAEDLIAYIAEEQREHEKQHGFEHDRDGLRLAAGHPDNKGQHDDPDHVVDDGGA